jgi:regulator of protease activity HflC (stomatin/prohibitin superfamily)
MTNIPKTEKDWFSIIMFSVAFLLCTLLILYNLTNPDNQSIYVIWGQTVFFLCFDIMWLLGAISELFNLKTGKMEDKLNYHNNAVTIMVISLVILISTSAFFWFYDNNESITIWVIRILSSLSSLYLITLGLISFRSIGPNEIGLVLQWGKPMFQVGPGLIWTPFNFIWKLVIETSLIIEEQYPGETPSGRQPIPIYITHGKSDNNTNDPLENRITTTASIVCRYKIADLIQFMSTIGNKDHLRRQIRDIVVTVVQVECVKESVVRNYNKLNEINTILKSTVEQLTSDWGIVIVTVQIQNIDLGGTINDALRNISVAKMNMEVDRYNSQKIFFEGSAKAEVEKALQYAKAEGYKKISQELGIDESIVLFQIDALAQLWKNNNTDIHLFSGDMSEIFKMVTAFSKITNPK